MRPHQHKSSFIVSHLSNSCCKFYQFSYKKKIQSFFHSNLSTERKINSIIPIASVFVNASSLQLKSITVNVCIQNIWKTYVNQEISRYILVRIIANNGVISLKWLIF